MLGFYGVWLLWYAVIPGCFPTMIVFVHIFTTAKEFLFDSFGGVVSMTVHFFPVLFTWRVYLFYDVLICFTMFYVVSLCFLFQVVLVLGVLQVLQVVVDRFRLL